jgi:hypothetical protein
MAELYKLSLPHSWRCRGSYGAGWLPLSLGLWLWFDVLVLDNLLSKGGSFADIRALEFPRFGLSPSPCNVLKCRFCNAAGVLEAFGDVEEDLHPMTGNFFEVTDV